MAVARQASVQKLQSRLQTLQPIVALLARMSRCGPEPPQRSSPEPYKN
jgi:hypothetical protein